MYVEGNQGMRVMWSLGVSELIWSCKHQLAEPWPQWLPSRQLTHTGAIFTRDQEQEQEEEEDKEEEVEEEEK